MYIRDKMNRMLSEYTGQPLEKIQLDTERDNYMSALQAKEYGLIDESLPTAEPPTFNLPRIRKNSYGK